MAAVRETDVAGDKESRKLHDTFHETWMSVLGVFHSAEGEVQRATNRLLEAVGIGPDHGPLSAEIKARISKNREVVERRIDEGVKAAVAKVRAPIDKELASLRERVETLSRKLDKRKAKAADAASAKK